MNENNQYLVYFDNEQFGPYSLETMREMCLTCDTLVKNLQLGGDYRPASSYQELKDYLIVTDTCEPIKLDTVSFYYKKNGEMFGPLSLWELAFLDIDENSELSIDNMQHWTLAKNIPGLIETICQISVESDSNQLNPNKEELIKIIKEQEEELMQLQFKMREHQWLGPTFDFSSDYKSRYISFDEKIEKALSSLNILQPKKEKYVKVFQSQTDEVEYYVETYYKTAEAISNYLSQIESIVSDATETHNNDLELLEGSLSKFRYDSVNELNIKFNDVIEESKRQIKELSDANLESKEYLIESLKRELEDKKSDLTRQINEETKRETLKINKVKSELDNMYCHVLSYLDQAKVILNNIDQNYSDFFDKSYNMASSSSSIWEKIEDRNQMPPSRLLFGNEEIALCANNCKLSQKKRIFFDFLNNQHMIVRHNRETKGEAEGFVNTLLARLIASSRPGDVQVSMIDTEDMSGTSNILTRLNRQVYSLCVKNEDARKLIDWMKAHIADIKVNLLQSPINNLWDYNLKKDNKEAYQILVIKGFPCGFGSDSITILNTVLRNGIDAGINVVLLIDEDELAKNEDSQKLMSRISGDLLKSCLCVNFANRMIDNNPFCKPDILSDEALTHIVQYANRGFEVRDDEKVILSDYIPQEEEWWRYNSAHHAEIPFGLTDDKQVAKLKITQESGQNSAIVIGIPGSGKSVFLHSVICNAIVNYSPDELNLYLIDFSGVEFNTYANHKLPHAKVIAPEAEREFGLSILTELVEEGSRRMTLCRENGVSNIVDLKAQYPEMRVPRLLVIIDEFQKIFEIENDAISRDANSKIHIIIQEFRKFGINLILATQRLPSNSILPKDLIANRIVFKSSMNDFMALISLPSTIRMPQLRTGECIYNSESGSQYDNSRVQGFFISMNEINELLDRVLAYNNKRGGKSADITVFRGNDLPNFSERRIMQDHRYTSDFPDEVGIYFGESIAINETDVCASIRKEAGNNVLVIGGETDVAQHIAYYATLSATTAHIDSSATFYVFNFIRNSAKNLVEIEETFQSLPFIVKMGNRLNDVMEYLTEIKTEIDARREDETRAMNHIYVSFYAFQLARIFDRGGRRGDDVSDCGKLLDYILRNGSTYGVFTILQVDNLESLSRIGTPINVFNYRVALQMSENDSNKVVGSSIANKIFVFNRPSSKFRAYYRDNNRNLTIKFKPYK